METPVKANFRRVLFLVWRQDFSGLLSIAVPCDLTPCHLGTSSKWLAEYSWRKKGLSENQPERLRVKKL